MRRGWGIKVRLNVEEREMADELAAYYEKPIAEVFRQVLRDEHTRLLLSGQLPAEKKE